MTRKSIWFCIIAIAHSGRGRMQIEEKGGKALVFVDKPEACNSRGVLPEPRSWIKTLELSKFEERVRNILKGTSAPCKF